MRTRVILALLTVALVVGCHDGSTSVPASTKPAATTIASATSAPTTVVVPPTFAPTSVTFVSSQTGWVLDTADCCTVRLWQTRDGGTSWRRVNGPPVSRSIADRGSYGVRFANLDDGYVFGETLWATHDGGATWTQIAYPHMAADTYVERLEISGRVAYALINPFEAGYRYRLLSTPVESEAWTDLYAFGEAAAPVQSAELVAQGNYAYALFNFRVVSGGALAVNGIARSWQPPCLGTSGPAALAASSTTELVAFCNEGVWGGTPARTVRVSHDGGATFVKTARDLTDMLAWGECVGTPSATTIVVSGSVAAGSTQLVGTFDGGKTWQTVWTSSTTMTAGCEEIGFTTPMQGVAIIGGQEPGLLMTRDGGHSWQQIRI